MRLKTDDPERQYDPEPEPVRVRSPRITQQKVLHLCTTLKFARKGPLERVDAFWLPNYPQRPSSISFRLCSVSVPETGVQTISLPKWQQNKYRYQNGSNAWAICDTPIRLHLKPNGQRAPGWNGQTQTAQNAQTKMAKCWLHKTTSNSWSYSGCRKTQPIFR